MPRPAPPEPLTEQIPRIDEALDLNLREALDPNLRTDIALPPISAAPPRGDVSAAETTWFQADGFAGEHIDQHGQPTDYAGDGYHDEGFEEDGFEDEDYEGEEEGYHQDGYQDEDYHDDEYAETQYAPHGYDDEDPEHVDKLEPVDGDDDEAEGLADDHFDDDDEYAEEETRRSPAKEWLVMVGQLGAGGIGGAGLWLGFQWLWRAQPAAALGVAVMIIVGLVWMVRKIRRADDLQTTFLAVLVGLVVTVSPAALLLVGR